MSLLTHPEEMDIPLVHFFYLAVKKQVHPKDTSCGLVGSVWYLCGVLERDLSIKIDL
jgi:hypothetical protein